MIAAYETRTMESCVTSRCSLGIVRILKHGKGDNHIRDGAWLDVTVETVFSDATFG